MGGRVVEVISSKGCSRLFAGLSSPLTSFRGNPPSDPMLPASSSLASEPVKPLSNGPFTGLVICVTGLSKEARKQVMEATERLGGQYSPNLHPQCTHLVVQSLGGPKFDHALKHGSRNRLFVVTIGWFVDSVRRNARLIESQYSINGVEENALRLYRSNKTVGYINSSENTCFSIGTHGNKQSDMSKEQHPTTDGRKASKSISSTLSGQCLYIDKNIPLELQNKVAETAAREGASLVDQWFVGCSTASHVVCEETSVQKYFGHSSNLVTPLWVLKTAKEKRVQKLVHMSADLARQVGTMLEEVKNKENGAEDAENFRGEKRSQAEQEKIVNDAKLGVRNRRNHRMQTCQIPMRPITPARLLDTVCWTISEPTSSASIYTDSFSGEAVSENHSSLFFDAKGDEIESEALFENLTRLLTQSEKSECILKIHFLTILFPVDQFGEMGPSSRTFFNSNGFTCLQVLDHIYAFYQEKMSFHEVGAAIHTDSRHADRLRAVYSSRATAEKGEAIFKRIDFLGSRKSFEMLKRVSGNNNSNVYELLLRA